MPQDQPTVRLQNGDKIPSIGFGAYLIPIDETAQAVEEALQVGYRLIDTASCYMNEAQCAEGITEFLRKTPSVSRKDIIYGSKIWETDYGYEKAVKAVQTSLDLAKDLGYMDYYLIHSTMGGKETRLGTYKALQEAVKRGEIKHIGISSWAVRHLKELYEWPGLEVEPSINQIELNPWLRQQDIVDFCQEKGIAVEAYSPLTVGMRLNDPEVVSLAKKYGKTGAQVLLKWAVQRGTIPIPKTVKIYRMRENFDLFSWELSEEDAANLGSDKDYFLTVPSWDPTKDD